MRLVRLLAGMLLFPYDLDVDPADSDDLSAVDKVQDTVGGVTDTAGEAVG